MDPLRLDLMAVNRDWALGFCREYRIDTLPLQAANHTDTDAPCPTYTGGGEGDPDCDHCAYEAGGEEECSVGEEEEQTLFYDAECGCCYSSTTPLLINLHGGVTVSDRAHGVLFDLWARGVKVLVPWPTDDTDGWLTLDRNGNGVIDDGRELFGSSSLLRNGSLAKDGFQALRELDTNLDGLFTRDDQLFQDVRVWLDKNHDGVSEIDELRSLDAVGIVSLGLDPKKSRKQDPNGNLLRYRAAARFVSGSTRYVYDVYLGSAR